MGSFAKLLFLFATVLTPILLRSAVEGLMLSAELIPWVNLDP
ncbi:hypothetical protein SynBIOSU31_00697 [Synechococcus sp. BIOS-U3-1]|nr:hypothetical protein SynBIOSU31_00697 [Synechococcus sp. BIOS-U3-1]